MRRVAGERKLAGELRFLECEFEAGRL
jgi:hypothetical protein